MYLFFLFLVSSFLGCEGSHLVHSQLQVYQRILGTSTITVNGMKTLMKLHDEDAVCGPPCERYLSNLLGGEEDGLEWTMFEKLVDQIYGNVISDDPYQPQEVHLAVTDNIEEMKVIWATMENLVDPFVEYTLSSNDWASDTISKLSATNYTYTVPQKWWPVFEGVLYEVNMNHLIPATSYKYRVGGYDIANNTIRRSKDFTFKSAPENNQPNQKTTFGCLADQSTFMLLGFATTNALAAMQDELGIDAYMYAGDLCYAGLSSEIPRLNISKDDEFEHVWDLWGIQNEPLAATRPFMVSPGNHEKFYDWTAYTNRYKMPYEKSGGNGNFWFSYDYGNVHWVSISTEESVEAGSEQMLFLEKDLANAHANRANVPWIILSLHRPIYCSDQSSYESHSPGGTYQVALEPLLLQYDVDLVLQGHLHAYERIHPNKNGIVSVFPSKYQNENGQEVDIYYAKDQGPIYVVQGNTGAMQVETWVHPQPEWSAVRFANGYIPPSSLTPENENKLKGFILESNYTDTFGFGVATFANSTHLHYRAIPVTGTIGVDEFWYVKRV